MTASTRHWIAVASAEHVALGRSLGFMQVCHGKVAPLRRLLPGDRVIYYSPTASFAGKDRLQAFTAVGTVHEGQLYQVEMTATFNPWRRNVDWIESRELPIRPLLDRLSFTQGGGSWGYKFRFGLFEIEERDANIITSAMSLNYKPSAGLTGE